MILMGDAEGDADKAAHRLDAAEEAGLSPGDLLAAFGLDDPREG